MYGCFAVLAIVLGSDLLRRALGTGCKPGPALGLVVAEYICALCVLLSARVTMLRGLNNTPLWASILLNVSGAVLMLLFVFPVPVHFVFVVVYSGPNYARAFCGGTDMNKN